MADPDLPMAQRSSPESEEKIKCLEKENIDLKLEVAALKLRLEQTPGSSTGESSSSTRHAAISTTNTTAATTTSDVTAAATNNATTSTKCAAASKTLYRFMRKARHHLRKFRYRKKTVRNANSTEIVNPSWELPVTGADHDHNNNIWWGETSDETMCDPNTHIPNEVSFPAPQVSSPTNAQAWMNQALTEQTHLNDPGWKSPSSRWMKVPSALAWRLLTRALILAKEAWHDFCKQNLPWLHKCEFHGGPHEVRSAGAVQQTRRLRNAFSHFEGQYLDAQDLDEYLKQAQALAVAVHDVQKSTKTRHLRDVLMNKAQHSLEEMENVGYLSTLQTTHDWQLHHEIFFKDRLAYEDHYHTYNGYRFSPAVALAIDAYDWQRDFD
ncbi:hypothetical protein PG987_015516 [Apiospora arundinis]